MSKHRTDLDLTDAVQRLIKLPGQFLGRTPSRPRGDYFPGRPADVTPVRSRLPRGVQGEQLGKRK